MYLAKGNWKNLETMSPVHPRCINRYLSLAVMKLTAIDLLYIPKADVKGSCMIRPEPCFLSLSPSLSFLLYSYCNLPTLSSFSSISHHFLLLPFVYFPYLPSISTHNFISSLLPPLLKSSFFLAFFLFFSLYLSC